MYFFPTFVVNTKYTVENTVVSTDSQSWDLGKVYSFNGTQGNMHFLPTQKGLENVLKSYMYCICFVCVGKCFCVAPAFLDVLYSWPCRWVLCLRCRSKGVCKVLLKSALRVGLTHVSCVQRIYWKYIQQINFFSMQNLNSVSWVVGYFFSPPYLLQKIGFS